MAKAVKKEVFTGGKAEFLKLFNQLCYARQKWQVWADLMEAMACAISNAVDRREEVFQKREERFAQAVGRLGGLEIPSKIFAITTMALEKEPEQDFLGDMYMSLNLGSHWHGQFFTPYEICRLMAEVDLPEVKVLEDLDNRHFITVNDPACGAGATLIAAINRFRQIGVDQLHFLTTGNDIDSVAAKMCYIQLSLLGAAGWVAITNTLSNPVCGDPLMPQEKEDQEFWYTPMFFHWAWDGRRKCKTMDSIIKGLGTRPKTQEGYVFVFSEKQEVNIVAETARKYTSAVDKLNDVRKKADIQQRAIIDYLIKRAEEDPGMAEDILQDGKTFKRCMQYIFKKARRRATGNMAMVKDTDVFEWAEDYFRMDEETETKELGKAGGSYAPPEPAGEEEPKEPKEEPKAEKKSGGRRKKPVKKTLPAAEDIPEEKPAGPKGPKKKAEKSKDLDGQMDLFSFFGGN